MSRKYVLYDTEEVLEAEFNEYFNKIGRRDNEAENDIVEAIGELASEFEERVGSDLESDNFDYKKWIDTFENTIEDENGDIWVLMKVIKIQDLRKKLGTEL